MAYLKPPKSKEEVARLGLSALRKEYNELAATFMKILDGDVRYDHAINDFLSVKEAFYPDKRFKSGVFPFCKKVVLDMATDLDKDTGLRVDNKAKAQWVLHLMDLPYHDDIFTTQMQGVQDSVNEKNRGTAFQQYLVMVKSLPQYRKESWKDSQFGDEGDTTVEEEVKRKARKEIKRIFGSGFSEGDYLYLQDQYDDWRARTQVDTKSQETYIVQICLQLLDIYKDRKQGKDVTNKLKALDQLMNSSNLQPKQNVNNAATDSLTFGQLLEKWEEERPIPDPDPEFADVNNIGKYIRVWFAGHLSKALGLKTAYTQEYEEEIEKYTVKKPDEIEGDETSGIYNELFGVDGE